MNKYGEWVIACKQNLESHLWVLKLMQIRICNVDYENSSHLWWGTHRYFSVIECLELISTSTNACKYARIESNNSLHY